MKNDNETLIIKISLGILAMMILILVILMVGVNFFAACGIGSAAFICFLILSERKKKK